MTEDFDERILLLAEEVDEVQDDYDLPGVLTQLWDLLEKSRADLRLTRKLHQDVWECGLLHVCADTLSLDFSRVPGSWDTAATLCQLLQFCCRGPPVNDREFLDLDVPTTILSLAKRFLTYRRAVMTSTAVTSSSFSPAGAAHARIRSFSVIISSLSHVCKVHPDLTPATITHPLLPGVLAFTDPTPSCACLNLVRDLVGMNKALVVGLLADAARGGPLLREIVTKLRSEDAAVVGVATNACIDLVTFDPAMSKEINRRGEDVAGALLQWSESRIGREVCYLAECLGAEASARHASDRTHQAATSIQTRWRGHRERSHFLRLRRSVRVLQRALRRWRQLRRRRLAEERKQRRLEAQRAQRERTNRMQRQEEEFDAIRDVPARDLDLYLTQKARDSAVVIQRHWRGARVRREVKKAQRMQQEHTAATRIQRGVRAMLRRRPGGGAGGGGGGGRNAEPARRDDFEELSAGRRAIIQRTINIRRQSAAPVLPSLEQFTENLNNANRLLTAFLRSRRQAAFASHHRKVRMAQVEIDTETLESAPFLQLAKPEHLDVFVSTSKPVRMAAQEAHLRELVRREQPWWRNLGAQDKLTTPVMLQHIR